MPEGIGLQKRIRYMRPVLFAAFSESWMTLSGSCPRITIRASGFSKTDSYDLRAAGKQPPQRRMTARSRARATVNRRGRSTRTSCISSSGRGSTSRPIRFISTSACRRAASSVAICVPESLEIAKMLYCQLKPEHNQNKGQKYNQAFFTNSHAAAFLWTDSMQIIH